ncbi:hypothetical protein M408DRAFT_15541 [Serendipita vermifera MAFF 305830]|uniref:Uncharacterized protein n=1 Tax=Serendipita vermifera MAFF 305830 TaxID=933852 RepID=A0A0C3BGM9_SERVB|nr:hypothetical protein M408DRAFT_15541 [Serendipita vermifera MAFF 305830]
MDLSPSSILLIPVVARLGLSVLRFSTNILFVEPSNAFLFCMGLGILTYKTIVNSSLISGIAVGISSRAVITYILQGRRWTVICGFLLGIFASDVVTLFWNYVNQHAEATESEGRRRRKKSSRSRRLSDPRPPSPTWASLPGPNGELAIDGASDKDTVSLKRRIAEAEATVRRVQEERQWALSQGNDPRAAQLQRQSQRNQALVRNYTKELEERRADLQKSVLSNTERSTTGRRVVVADMHDSVISDPQYSDPEHVRMHTREHLTQRFTLEDGSQVQLTQLHLGRTKEKEPERLRGRSVPVTIIESPIHENTF